MNQVQLAFEALSEVGVEVDQLLVGIGKRWNDYLIPGVPLPGSLLNVARAAVDQKWVGDLARALENSDWRANAKVAAFLNAMPAQAPRRRVCR